MSKTLSTRASEVAAACFKRPPHDVVAVPRQTTTTSCLRRRNRRSSWTGRARLLAEGKGGGDLTSTTMTDARLVYADFKNSVDEWQSVTTEGTSLFSKPLSDGSVPLQLQNVLDKLLALVEKMYTYRTQLQNILMTSTVQDALERFGKPIIANNNRKSSKDSTNPADDDQIVVRPSAVDLAISLEEELGCFEQEIQFRTTLVRGCIAEWPISAEQYAACKASWIASPYLLEFGKGPFARLVETLDVDKSLRGRIR